MVASLTIGWWRLLNRQHLTAGKALNNNSLELCVWSLLPASPEGLLLVGGKPINVGLNEDIGQFDEARLSTIIFDVWKTLEHDLPDLIRGLSWVMSGQSWGYHSMAPAVAGASSGSGVDEGFVRRG